MMKDENPTYLNVLVFILFIMVFGCINSIWTNFIPNEKWVLISKIISVIAAILYASLSFLCIDNKESKYKKAIVFILVLVACHFLFYFNFSYSIPSVITELSDNEFQNEFVVVEKRERKLPLLKDPNCPYRIYITEVEQNNSRQKVCLSYKELGKFTVNDVISIQGKESWFDRKIKEIS